ncbi:hypothetical protein CJP72_24080 [Citrobacter sp. NCU1]|uniref:hypothetical protein n=1 Tax=Citrobacter sp. NCU1 TaxID=2026683 RepID=UPI0013919452|nr:hypothetical protein [Citrobacter sp. NCU1]NDO83710.1 hypothetical protein [Citrobacter sp. NCU1]
MSKIPLQLDDLYSGNIPNAIVKLTCPGYTKTQFIAPIVNDFGLSASSAMTQPFDEYMSGIQNKLQTATMASTMGSAAAAKVFDGQGIDFSKFAVYKTRAQTIRMYQGSQFGGLNLDMIFIVTSRSNIRRYHDAIELSSCVYPDPNFNGGDANGSRGAALQYFQMNASALTQQLRPPCGYKIGANGIPQNTWNIQIGTYFRAGGFVLENAAMTQSKERMGQGEALITTVSCQFGVALDVTCDQYKSWFIK